jgi:hypothetical protein
MMLRVSRQFMASVGAAVVAGLLSLSMANAETVPDTPSSSHWAADVFAKILRDQAAISDQAQPPDIWALSYARSGTRLPWRPYMRDLARVCPRG